jgi:hypothetical protein
VRIEGKKMKDKISILDNYKEGSRTGNVSLFKGKKGICQIFVDWDDPRYKRILLFSGKLNQCVNFSMNRFGIKKQGLNSLKL